MCFISFVHYPFLRLPHYITNPISPNTFSLPISTSPLNLSDQHRNTPKPKTRMMKLRYSKKFCRGSFKFGNGGGSSVKGGDQKGTSTVGSCSDNNVAGGEIKWELRPGGMLVQKREMAGSSVGEGMIVVRVSTVSRCHDISIEATSTFGELKMILSMVTSLEPREQRIIFKGKEREDEEYLHMVGVRDKDKVVLLQDPAIKEMKMKLLHRSLASTASSQQQIPAAAYRTISV